MSTERIFMQQDAILDVTHGMARILRHRLDERKIKDPVMIGIHTGGVWVAEQLHRQLGIQTPLGMLDISFYRDDFTRIGMNPRVKPSQIPFAMNEIFDFGRPASIILVALIERSGRELPIQADVIGLKPPLAVHEHIRLQGPEKLQLKITVHSSSGTEPDEG